MRLTQTFAPPTVNARRDARIKAAAATADINCIHRERIGIPAGMNAGERSAAGDGEQGREL